MSITREALEDLEKRVDRKLEKYAQEVNMDKHFRVALGFRSH